MNLKPVRFLSLMLCMAMLIGMLPCVPVSAEELSSAPEENIVETIPEETISPADSVEEPVASEPAEPEETEVPVSDAPAADSDEQVITETEEAPVLNAGSTFTQADFAAGLKNDLDEYGCYYLTESVTLTEHMVIDGDIAVYIAAGVTLEVPAGMILTLDDVDLIPFEGATIKVAGGIALINNATVQVVGGTLDVSAAQNVAYEIGDISLHLNDTAKIIGIHSSQIIARAFPITAAELETALAATGSYYLLEVTPEASITLTKSLVIPADTILNMVCFDETITLTVPATVTLTNNGQISVGYDTVLEISEGGTLVNNNVVTSYGEIICNGTWEGNDVSEDNGSVGSYSTFSTFAELKEIAGSSTGYIDCEYVGEGPLVISESIDLPETVSIYAEKIVIPADVTFTVRNYVSVNHLEVAGTLVCDYGYVYAEGSVTITGNVYLDNGSLEITEATVISGMENISHSGYGAFYINYEITDKTDLENTFAVINSFSYEDAHHLIALTNGNITLDKNFTLPSDCTLYIFNNATLTVAENCTFTVNPSGFLGVNSDFVVKGALVNYGSIEVNYDQGGNITFTGSNPYTGHGTIRVFSDTLNVPDAAISGLGMDAFDVTFYNDYSKYWELNYAGELTKLGTPTELAWGMELHYEWDETSGEPVVSLIPGRPSNVSWKSTSPDQHHYRVNVYLENGDNDVKVGSWMFSKSVEYAEIYEVEEYAVGSQYLESGNYYFTVQSLGDHTEYRDSDIATSGLWSYTKPAAKLPIPTNLEWNRNTTSFTFPENKNHGGFEVEWFFSPTEVTITEENYYEYIVGGHLNLYGSEPEYTLEDRTIQACGNGYYYYRVRALSKDITLCCNGDWSEISPAYYMTANSNQVKNELDTIITNDAASIEEKVESVQNMDTSSLKEAMLADDEVVSQIAALEEAAGGAAAIEVTDGASAFAESQISIVGANLNTAADSTQDIKLVVDKPEADHIIPEAYNNSVAVSFSMDLTNVEDSENLKVPVQITLPVPTTINPDFMVILHYHAATGEPEVIHPNIYLKDGQYYAEFVLTSFSDFIITEPELGVTDKGDLDADGQVTDADVEYLLWHTLFPDMFPLFVDADFDGDGAETDADVEYLLWHTLFPDMFPL